MSLSELSKKLEAILPAPSPAREHTCDECGYTGPEVEASDDPSGSCPDTGYRGQRFLCSEGCPK